MIPRQIRELPNADIIELEAFYTWKQAMEKHQYEVAEMRAKHG